MSGTVLASDNEFVLLAVTEPSSNGPRKSQAQIFLEQNEGPGCQHIALKTDDIFKTLRHIKAMSSRGGFSFMPRAPDQYYRWQLESFQYVSPFENSLH